MVAYSRLVLGLAVSALREITPSLLLPFLPILWGVEDGQDADSDDGNALDRAAGNGPNNGFAAINSVSVAPDAIIID